MSGHKHILGQICLRTNMSGDKHVWSQICLGTNVPGQKRVRAQSCGHSHVGTTIYGHKCGGTIYCTLTIFLDCIEDHYSVLLAVLTGFWPFLDLLPFSPT